MLLDGVVDQCLSRRDVGCAVGKDELRVLEPSDRRAERCTAAGVVHRVLDCPAGGGAGADGIDQALLRQVLGKVPEGVPFFPDAVLDRDADVVERKFARVLSFQAQFVEHTTDGEPR